MQKPFVFAPKRLVFAPKKGIFALEWPCFCTSGGLENPKKIQKKKPKKIRKKNEKKGVLKVAKGRRIAAYFWIGLNLGSAAELGPVDALGRGTRSGCEASKGSKGISGL